MKRLSLCLLFCFCALLAFSQAATNQKKTPDAGLKLERDTLMLLDEPIPGTPHAYLLFIPKGTPLNKLTYLLVEPNNTGRTSDSMAVHLQHAVALASKRSIGNNIATELRIPLLVPVFPRPASKPLVYTHALDRDAMMQQDADLKRLDLQLIAMLEDAKSRLRALNILVHDQVFMNGFSASATFVNRFAFLHPQLIKALATGGLNGKLMLPLNRLNNKPLNYPLGLHDFEKISGKPFDLASYKQIPQFIYMGQLDENDAVLYDDAYSPKERKVIYAAIGKQMQPQRWQTCQKIYQQQQVNALFTTYEKVGHWTTGPINLEIIKFFHRESKK